MAKSSELESDQQVASATRTLALLNSQADKLRTELVKLRKELLAVQRELKVTRGKSKKLDQHMDAVRILTLGSQLQQANEQLVLATLNAENIAEIAVNDLTKLTQASQRDVLTGTPNRALMFDRLESAIANAQRRDARLAVLFLDVDKFKEINDSLGHAVGDDVLKLVTHHLQSVVRDSDTVSRHGGDEFLILLAEIMQPSDAGLIASKILASLATPNSIAGFNMSLSVSIGIAIYPDDTHSAAELINLADAAMYTSKRRGHGCFEFHQADDNS